MTVWLDVDDLIRFFQTAKRPTGIQRFSFEVCAAASALAGDSQILGFCRRNDLGTRLLPVNFTALEAHIRTMSEQLPQAPVPVVTPDLAPAAQPSRLFGLARRLAPAYRTPLGELYRASISGGLAVKSLAKASLAALRPAPHPRLSAVSTAFEPAPKPLKLQPGDWLINLGAS